MAKNLDEYRCKLVNKIIQSRSQEEVKRYINAAVKGMKDHNVNGYITVRFVERVICELDKVNPLEYTDQQWHNIASGKSYAMQIKNSLTPASSAG